MQYFKDGESFERILFGEPERIVLELGSFKPISFSEDLGRIIRHLSRSKSHRKYPKTQIAKSLYFGVKKELASCGVSTSGLRLLSLVGSHADRYYETDALFYLPLGGYESAVVTVDARWINPILFHALRDYWIESSRGLVYSELNLQKDLFAHNRIFDEHHKRSMSHERWILSGAYKSLWEGGYLPAIPEEMVDRPTVRPKNHLLLTQYHVEEHWRRKAFTRFIATELFEQIKTKTSSCPIF